VSRSTHRLAQSRRSNSRNPYAYVYPACQISSASGTKTRPPVSEYVTNSGRAGPPQRLPPTSTPVASRIAYLRAAGEALTVQVFPPGILAMNVAPGPSSHKRAGPFFAVRWIVERRLVRPTRSFLGSVVEVSTRVRE
jgi:hypothetical protein